MDKVVNLIKNTIEEIDKNLRTNLDGSIRVRLNPSLEKLLLVLDSPEIRYSLEKYEDLSKKFEMINKEPLNCSQLEKGMSLCVIQKSKIVELEAKLAESEKLKDDALYNYAWLNQEVSDIKQKLKDNEDAYKILCCNHQNLGKAYNELEQKLEDAYCNDAIHQDKISFAAQALENLRNEINANGHYFKVDTEFYKYIYETIGEKIKRLKGGV